MCVCVCVLFMAYELYYTPRRDETEENGQVAGKGENRLQIILQRAFTPFYIKVYKYFIKPENRYYTCRRYIMSLVNKNFTTSTRR